jgi:hypothetical protein
MKTLLTTLFILFSVNLFATDFDSIAYEAKIATDAVCHYEISYTAIPRTMSFDVEPTKRVTIVRYSRESALNYYRRAKCAERKGYILNLTIEYYDKSE